MSIGDTEFYHAVAGLVDQIEMDNYESRGGYLKNNTSYRHVKRLANASRLTVEGQKWLEAQFEKGDHQMPDTVRAKFTCTSVSKSKAWNKDKGEFLYAYKMQVVTGDSPENKQFFASTPSGSLEVGAVRDDLFEPGKSYYLDFTPAE